MLSELSVEKLANLHAKNRVEYSNLSSQLNRIEKEKRLEVKMVNTEKLKFRAKYVKATLGLTSSEAADVKMYETHTPGFCFKRNGDQRVPQSSQPAPTIDIEHLHFLLFTNGEVDIEKMLCLHLLSSHETKHLVPPKRINPSMNFMKKDSPLEQIIERSKEFEVETSSTALPTYILDVGKQDDYAKMKEDERLACKLLVNEKILKLITTVMKALENTNPEKIRDLMSAAADPSSLKRIFKKPHIQEFVMMLKENALINSCSSFVLSQSASGEVANHIEIRTPSGALEDLVRFIRSSVLQFPTRRRESLRVLEQDPSRTSPGVVIEEAAGPQRRPIDHRRITSPRFKSEVVRRDPSQAEDLDVEFNPFRRTTKNFIARNIAAVANYRRTDEGEEPKSFPVPATLRQQQKRRSVSDERRTSEGAASVSREPRLSRASTRRSLPGEEVKVHTKQTTCAACMEKWKTPLPDPKVSRLMRTTESSVHSMERESVTSDRSATGGGGGGGGGGVGTTGGVGSTPTVAAGGATPLLTRTSNVQQRISTLINQEQFKLDSYDRRYSNASNTGIGFLRRRSNSTPADPIDQMDLNVFDLEKIRHEIREKETKKKLEKFLGE